MRAKDPKQAVIDTLTDPDPRIKREERGMLAKPDSLLFLKEKNHRYVHAYVVHYTSTTNQEWYDTSLVVQNIDGSFTRRYEIYCKAEDRFLMAENTQMVDRRQPWLRVSAGGEKPPTQTGAQKKPIRETKVQETRERNTTQHTLRIGTSIAIDSVGDVIGYRFFVGYLIANGQDVASVRMVPHVGPAEEDEVRDNTVLFLCECSHPVIFEFYNTLHALIATQRWNI